MEFRKQSPDLHSSLAQAALNNVQEVQDGSFFEAFSGSPLSSIEHFCQSSQSFQRLAYTQGIAAAAAGPTADYGDCVEVLLPLVQQLTRDSEAEIRATVIKQLPELGIALFDKDAERSMRDIEATLLVCAQQCALDDEDEVSQASILAFQQLVQLLPSARATAASKRAVDRLESQGSDDGILAALRLLAHTVAFWTPEALKRHVPRYISRWASHREFSVREAAATCMSLVLPAMPLRLCHQVLLPAFYQLSRDQNWRVRRACALDLPRLAGALQDRPADPSTPTACSSSSSNHSNWQQDVESEQPLGVCSSRASSCLTTMQRYSAEISSAQLAASLASASGPQRNKSYPSLTNRSPATTAQIMTKHPMHSSLIMDGLLSGSSSCSSMPVSPSGSSDLPSLAQDSHEEPSSMHTQQHHRHQHHSSSSSGLQQQRGSLSDSEQPEHHEQPQCRLEQQAPLLHDCWCALRQCMELLTADSSHWVKVAALSGLGPFLLQLPPCQLGQLLLGRFTSMAGSTVVIYEVSVALACAQAFGRLAVLLGPERWHDMRDAWHALQASRDPAVLCEVVNCLPQLMAALGPVLAHREMVPALAGLLQSHLSWIGGQLVLVMADLLTHLPHSGQELLLKTLPQLSASSSDRNRLWRVRRDLALQLGRLAAAAGPEAIENSLWPTAMSLCYDPVAAVRTAAASQIGPILAVLPSHMLQSQLGDTAADSCSACTSARLSSSPMVCQPTSALVTAAAAAQAEAVAAVAAASAAAEAAAAASKPHALDHSSSFSVLELNCSQDNLGDAGSDTDGSAAASSRGGLSKSSNKHRSFAVRFALEDNTPSSPIASSSSPSCSALGPSRQSPGRPSVLSEFMAGSRSSSMHSASSGGMDFDELELPSALAPAPAGCFSAHSDSGDESGSDDAAADGSGSSGLSTSSSRSSNGGSHHSDSSSDESGNESDTDSEDEGDGSNSSSAGSQRWRGVVSTEQQDAAGSSGGREGTPVAEVAPAEASLNAASPGSSTTAVAVPAKPLYAMHPAMMPVGALSAAAAASGAAPRPVPVTKRRALPNRARSTGDLLRMQPAPAPVSANPEDSTLDRHRDSVVSRFKEQHVRQLADSLPNGLLASSSDEDLTRDSSSGGWTGSLPQPAHAAPNQYLPVLIEFFGCSSSHQQRQLFVPVVMGLLACCHRVLSCAQQAVLLDRLEALAHDNVPGVRYAVAAALADVRAQAAALTGQQQRQQQLEGIQDEHVQQQEDAAQEGVQAESQQQSLDAQSAHEAAGQQGDWSQPDGADAAAAPKQLGEVDGLAGQVRSQQGQQQDVQQQEQRQPQLQQHDGAQAAEDTASPVQSSSQPEAQLVGHVPKGAHPLLGYQAYVQQLAQMTSRDAATICSPASSSSAARASPAGKSPASAAALNGKIRVNGKSSSALPPRSSPSTGSIKHQRQQQQQAFGAGAAGQTPSQTRVAGGAGAGQPGAAGPGGAEAAAGDAAQAAEWLMKLSNCQQLERLMHVVALTTGPL